MALSFGMPLEVCDALGKRSILPTHGRPAGKWRRRAITPLTIRNKTVFMDNVYRQGCGRQFVSQLGALAVGESLRANSLSTKYMFYRGLFLLRWVRNTWWLAGDPRNLQQSVVQVPTPLSGTCIATPDRERFYCRSLEFISAAAASNATDVPRVTLAN